MRTAILLALVLAACESSSSAPATGTDTDPRRGAMLPGSAPAARLDAGTPPDALALPDVRPVDVLATTAPDSMPAQQSDAQAVLAADTMPAVVPDAQVQQVDTFRPTDAKPAVACRWSNKASGQTADVYLAEGPSRCGSFGNLSCSVGCVAISVVVGGGIEKLTSRGQAIEAPAAGCKAYFQPGDAAVEAPGLCFPDAESCAKFCQ